MQCINFQLILTPICNISLILRNLNINKFQDFEYFTWKPYRNTTWAVKHLKSCLPKLVCVYNSKLFFSDFFRYFLVHTILFLEFSSRWNTKNIFGFQKNRRKSKKFENHYTWSKVPAYKLWVNFKYYRENISSKVKKS